MGLRGREKLRSYHCFFVTTTCHDFLPLLQDERCKQFLNESIKFVNAKYKAEIVAYVWMPNHIHLICIFTGDSKLPEYMRDFKKYTAFRIRDLICKEQSNEAIDTIRYVDRKQKFKVWMDRFDDLYLLNTKTLITKLNSIHNNPVRKELCSEAWQYKHSSASFYTNGEEPLIPILHCNEII